MILNHVPFNNDPAVNDSNESSLERPKSPIEII
jgi:hypothetical protein